MYLPITYIEIATVSFFKLHGQGLIVLPVRPSIIQIFESFVKMKTTSSKVLFPGCFGFFTRLRVFFSSFQLTEITGELEQDTSSVKNKSDNEVMLITAT